MCIIERYNLVHPNGAPERKDHLLYCPFGSPVNPCNNTRIEYLPDAFVQWPEPAPGSPYRAERIEPREAPRRSRQEETRKSKKSSNGLKLVWDFHIPFTSRKSEKKKKKRPAPKNVFVRRRGSQQPHETQNAMPPAFRVRPPGYGPPLEGGPEVVQIPHGPQQHAPRAAEPQVIRPRRNHPLNVRIHQAGDSSSPSPPTPLRQHHRHHTRTPSETRRYEELKREVRETERRAHVERQLREQAERDAREAREARQRETELLRRENRGLREQRRRQEQDERRRNREQERRRMEEQDEERRQRRIRRDDQRRLESEQRRLESEQQARRRRQQEDNETEQARRRQEREDREALQEEAVRERLRRDQMRRDQEDRDRLERQRRAGIPRGPRHRPEVHHGRHVSFEERGDQVIDDAIREQDRRQFEDRAPAPPRRDLPRRRDGGGGGRQRYTSIYDDDRRRGGRRHV
ncbi:MAG: hypothetical protein HETSPECPRED_001611 [Heterodermia speciosa]|uniref:Uncharacterized protein n=1 Tax=Heterodermia speciosa TaxID=116794 RepID=A0A8H3EWC6_9LECA|nr:MAG: hypothetical protein HETSPECPRED_001611 [Heterodermia speciosa]